MKKSLVFVICAIFLILPLVSCLPSATSQSSNPVAYQSDITALQDADRNLDNGIKAVDGRVTAWADKVTAAETKIGILQGQSSANTYTKDQLYTKTEIDAAIAKAINDYKAGLTSSGSSTGGASGGTTGQVTWITNPLNVQTLGSQQVCYTIKITNGTAQWVYIRPIININLHTGQSPLSVALLADNVTVSIGGGAGNFADNEFTVTGTTTSAILVGTKEIQLGANTTADLLVCITVTGIDARIWDIMSSFNWRSL